MIYFIYNGICKNKRKFFCLKINFVVLNSDLIKHANFFAWPELVFCKTILFFIILYHKNANQVKKIPCNTYRLVDK